MEKAIRIVDKKDAGFGDSGVINKKHICNVWY